MNIKITKKGNAWFNTGHPWIYKDDIINSRGVLQYAPTSINECIVDVLTENNKFLAKAFYNPASQIALRIITKKEEVIDKNFWAGRIKQAFDYRKCFVKNTNAYRLVFSESDNMPGLIVDLYDNIMVVQLASLGVDLMKEDIKDALIDIFKPKAIICRNDFPMRRLEGLKEEKSVLFGKMPELVEVFEGDIKYLVDVANGHKTGLYLDQRENRFIVGDIVGTGQCSAPKRVLDTFCYQGGFSLHLAKYAKEVISIDSSQPSLDMLNKNMELNHIKNVTAVNAKVFDKLKEFARSDIKFDVIVLDPPPFAKSKREIGAAKRGYKELNLRAMQCLNKGGYLVTFSCSYNFSEEELLHTVRLASGDAKKDLCLIAKLIQSKDHPACVTIPESYYLKGFVLKVR